MDIASISSAVAGGTTQAVTGASAAGGGSFADILQDAIDTTQQTSATDAASTMQLLAGQDVSIHTAMIDAEQAKLSLSLTIQITNKVIEAYNEVLRMQI